MGNTWIHTLALLLYLQHTTAKCLNITEITPKRFLEVKHNLEQFQRLPITLDVSRRITHQITSHIVKIVLEEVLGYPDVILRESNDLYNETGQTRKRMSAGVGEENSPPETILNTEVWISPIDKTPIWFENHRVKQFGPIGPPGRFGWFIPKSLANNNTEAFWKTFLSPATARVFSLSKEIGMLKILIYNIGISYCNEVFCQGGMYIPAQCKNQTCATLLAGYADQTGFVVGHIERLGLLVQVVWLGPHLAEMVTDLTARLRGTGRSLVALTYTPGAVVLPDDQGFVSVAFPPCEEFDTGCKYELHTLTKMYSTLLEEGAVHAYEAYRKISFTQEEYRELLIAYRSNLAMTRNSSVAVAEAACGWLRSNNNYEAFKSGTDSGTTLYIGGIFPMNPVRSVANYDTNSIVTAAQMAQRAVNSNPSILRGYHLELTANDGKCEADMVLKTFIDHIMQEKYKNLVGILGPACSNTLEPLAGVSRYYRTIVISYSAEGSSFSDRKKYPYFFRTIGENNQYQQVYLQLLTKLNWRRLAALTEDGQKYTEYLSHLQDLLTRHNYTFVMNRKFPAARERSATAMRSYLEDMKSKSVRIIIGDVYDDAAREMMCQAYQLQMTAYQSYVWFLPAWLAPDWYDTDKYNKLLTGDEIVPCTTRQMLEAINGHLSLSHAAWAPDSAVMQTNHTVGEWRRHLVDELRKKPKKRTEVSSYAGYAYDAVWMFALALDQLDQEDPSALAAIHSPKATKRYFEILEKTDFNGVSGRIQFRGNPSRISVVEVRQWLNNVTHIVGVFQPNVSALDKDPLAGTLFLNDSSITWLTPDRLKPKDGTIRCALGLAEFFGFDDCSLFFIIANILGFGILVIIVAVGVLVIKNRYDKKVQQTHRILDSYGLDLLNVGNLEKWEIPRDKVVINRKLGEGAFGYVYGGEAHLDSKGWVAVAVKTLKVGSTPEEKLEFLCEAEVMKRFDHKNIIQLLGVCTKNEPVYTVMEFMLYGDLKTFLLARRHLVNEKVSEETDEISSKKLTGMALDVARGLSYLAELKFVHRDVASRNCLVNATRVVKLGDFGMTRPMFDKDYYKFCRKGMLPVRWMSPESLGMGMFTPASDIWSYGVLLYEIITFGSFPFQGMTNNQVLEYVKAGNTLPIPTGVKPQAEALIRSCWNSDFKKRPKASEIVEFIANNPRLLHPCLDVPLASVQTDDSGSFSFSLRNRNNPGIFNSPSQWSFSNGGVGTPALWAQEYPEPELGPVGEEETPEWDRPLLSSPDKYVLIQPSAADSTRQEDSFL